MCVGEEKYRDECGLGVGIRNLKVKNPAHQNPGQSRRRRGKRAQVAYLGPSRMCISIHFKCYILRKNYFSNILWSVYLNDEAVGNVGRKQQKNIRYKVEKSLKSLALYNHSLWLHISYNLFICHIFTLSYVNGSTFSNLLFVDEQTIAVLGLHSRMRWFCTPSGIKSCSWQLNCGEWKGQLAIV